MKQRLVDWLVCPICETELELRDADGHEPVPTLEVAPASPCRTCRAPESEQRREGQRNCGSCYGIEVDSGALVCAEGHSFPIVDGVPRVVGDRATTASGDPAVQAQAVRSIQASFSHEWKHFNYEEDRTWGDQSAAQRAQDFLRMVHLPPAALQGRIVLDAGCGNGALSRELNKYGCEVVAADLSDGVVHGYRHFARVGNDRTHFVQANLMHPPFRTEAFDVVFCAGVLHHTPDTRRSFETVARCVAPGGTMFVWLYWEVPGLKYRLSRLIRRILCRLPAKAKHAIVKSILLPQSMARQWVRTRVGIGDQRRLGWRERLVVLLDSYTPRYRWEHTPEEVSGWYRQLGYTEIATTERGPWGFGVRAQKPADLAATNPSSDRPVVEARW